MSKGTAKSGTRSRRKPSKQLKGQVRRVDGGENATVQLTLPIKELLAGVSGAIESLAGEAGLLIMKRGGPHGDIGRQGGDLRRLHA